MWKSVAIISSIVILNLMLWSLAQPRPEARLKESLWLTRGFDNEGYDLYTGQRPPVFADGRWDPGPRDSYFATKLHEQLIKPDLKMGDVVEVILIEK